MILGRFYLKRTQDRNLIGQFSNQAMNENITENAIFTGNGRIDDDFVGNYDSTWVENGEGQRTSTLEIRLIPNTQLYRLTWINANESIEFHGEGFVIDNMLIGDYRDLEIQNLIGSRNLRQ
ncbi:MAG: hypothetical protein DCE86_16865 [Flavobacteriaceae bacterium]|jgi:hypothetical protein|nr:MAG: hypothetical protein DCE86_16865 [Flavobacteriaceae bacterium]PZQ85806.1 MAG: hypothetical protein DI548_08280 [Flavobacterium johnsoniae]